VPHRLVIAVSLASSTTRALLATVLASATGCFAIEGGHGLRFDVVREPPAFVVTESKSYFFWGLVPTRHVDVLEKCPYGVTAVSERTDALGSGAFIPTLGLWSRRTSTYYCRAAPRAGETR
jgi:hypothetical protein